MPAEAKQDNRGREQAIMNVYQAMKELGVFKDLGFTVFSPEESPVFPSAYIVGGDSTREPKDLQMVHYEQVYDVILQVTVKEVVKGELGLELERLIVLILDKIDKSYRVWSEQYGFDQYVSRIETDNGSLASVNLPLAAAILTVKTLLPAKDQQ